MIFKGEYLLVFSATNKKLGQHIKEILEKPRFSMKNEDKHTRIIWIIDNYYKEEGKEPQYKVDEDIGTVWQEKLEILKEGTFPPKCFVNKSREPTPVAKFKIDVFDPENLKQLEKIGEKLTTAILFSDGSRTDSKLPLLVSQLQTRFKRISIAAEYTQPENKYCLEESGADEVFSREVLLNNIMALNILKSKAKKGKNNGNETGARLTDFIGILMSKNIIPIKEPHSTIGKFSRRQGHKKKVESKPGKHPGFVKLLNPGRLFPGKKHEPIKDESIKIESIKDETRIDESIKTGSILGMRSAYLRSIRLNLEENKEFPLDKSRCDDLQDKAKNCNIRLLAVFCNKNGSNFQLEPLHPNPGIPLKSGDSLLLLTYSTKDISKFEEEIYNNEKGIFVENKKNTDEK